MAARPSWRRSSGSTSREGLPSSPPTCPRIRTTWPCWACATRTARRCHGSSGSPSPGPPLLWGCSGSRPMTETRRRTRTRAPRPQGQELRRRGQERRVGMRLSQVWISPNRAAGLHHSRWSPYTATSPGMAPEPVNEDDTEAVESDEAAREAAEAAAGEERRRVLVNDKAWRSSTTVRRDWLRQFASRKAAPSGAEALITAAVLGCQPSLGQAFTSRHSLLRQWRPAAADEPHPGWDSSACSQDTQDDDDAHPGGGPRRLGGRRHRVDVAQAECLGRHPSCTPSRAGATRPARWKDC